MQKILHAIPDSRNKKLGGMPAISSDSDTCPDRCKLKHPVTDPTTGRTRAPACYGKHGSLGINWRRLDTAKRAAGNLILASDLPDWIVQHTYPGQLWRDRVVGDQYTIPTMPDIINPVPLRRVHAANRKVGAKGFGYTAHSMHVPENRAIVMTGYASGYVLNASNPTLEQAFALKDAYPGLSVVATAPADETRRVIRQGRRMAVMCPNVYDESITCKRCGACAVPSRESIVVFPAHGSAAKSLDIIASA